MSDADVQAEVARGARFVLFNWCVSVFVLTFKRGSDVYFVRPGQNLFWPSYWCTLSSLCFGWWGIPWGIIYTIQSFVNNATGGVDLTPQITANLPPPLPGAVSATEPVLREQTVARARGNPWAPLAALGTVMALIALLVLLAQLAEP